MWTIRGRFAAHPNVQVQIDAPNHAAAARKAKQRGILAHSIVLNTDTAADREMAIAAARAMGEPVPITQNWKGNQ